MSLKDNTDLVVPELKSSGGHRTFSDDALINSDVVTSSGDVSTTTRTLKVVSDFRTTPSLTGHLDFENEAFVFT